VTASTIARFTGIALEGARRITAELGHQPSRVAPHQRLEDVC
jgi:hypothetical protein